MCRLSEETRRASPGATHVAVDAPVAVVALVMKNTVAQSEGRLLVPEAALAIEPVGRPRVVAIVDTARSAPDVSIVLLWSGSHGHEPFSNEHLRAAYLGGDAVGG